MSFCVYTIGDGVMWDNALQRMHSYDFYHTYSYNMFYADNNSNPILFHYKNGAVEIVLPLIIRDIIGSDYKDATSSYGYVGPLSSAKYVDELNLKQFHQELNDFFIESNIISVFSRLHPSLNNDSLLLGLGRIVPLSQTVYIDLFKSDEEQRRDFKKGVKSDLSRLNKGEFSIFYDEKLDYIDDFVSIYNENMVRVGARDEYFFSKEYYDLLFFSKDIDARLYFVVKDGLRIAGSIFVFTKQIIQYHLSGTRTDYLKNSPVRMLIDHIRHIGSDLNLNEFHLGGGVGSSEDSLFQFKAGFSHCRHQFKVWQYVVNRNAYDQLVLLNNSVRDLNYFPLYRSV